MNIKDFILGYVIGKNDAGGGGGDIDVDSLTVTENGTYTAEEGTAYSPVVVNVPNSYTQSDEGKVVSNGALVAQSSDTATQNGTVDTTLINSLLVNVSGGGGASNVVTGTFTAGAAGTINTVNTGYTGNGYPIVAIIVVDGGMYNSDNTAWYDLVKRYAIGFWCMTKAKMGTAPSYNNGAADYASVMAIAKSSATMATGYNAGGEGAARIYKESQDPYEDRNFAVSVPSKNTFKYISANTSYGFAEGITYRFWFIYSE